jgi:hypothetical protein
MITSALLRDQLSGRVGRHFGLADVVLDEELDLPAQNAAPGVDVLDHQLDGLHRRKTIGSKVSAVGTGHADLDRLGGRGRAGQGKNETKYGYSKKKALHHENPPFQDLNSRWRLLRSPGPAGTRRPPPGRKQVPCGGCTTLWCRG